MGRGKDKKPRKPMSDEHRLKIKLAHKARREPDPPTDTFEKIINAPKSPIRHFPSDDYSEDSKP